MGYMSVKDENFPRAQGVLRGEQGLFTFSRSENGADGCVSTCGAPRNPRYEEDTCGALTDISLVWALGLGSQNGHSGFWLQPLPSVFCFSGGVGSCVSMAPAVSS